MKQQNQMKAGEWKNHNMSHFGNSAATVGKDHTIASQLRQKLGKNQTIDISQIKQYYDIQSHNVSYQYAPSNPIGPKQLNDQAHKPDYIDSNSFSSPVKTELSETPQMMRKSKRVAFNESQISQIIPIDQNQINYMRRNLIDDSSNTKGNRNIQQENEQVNECNQNIKIINQEYERSQMHLDDDPIQIEAISQSVTPVKINRNVNFNTNNNNINRNSTKEEMFSCRKSGNMTRLSTNQSLCDEQILEEIKNWEKMFDVDKTVLGKVETTFKEMEDRISDLEAQFEICYNLTGKMEQKYQDLHKLLKGAPVFKVSRANKKKANLRIFFYSPSLEAFCWKAPKDSFPSKKQLVYIKNIKEVHTRLDASRKLPSPFKESQYLRIVMIDKKESDLELICEDTQLRTILLKVISSLIEDIRKSQHFIKSNNPTQDNDTQNKTPSLINAGANCEFLISKYSKDIQNIKDQITNSKGFFGDSTQMLRTAFFQATQSLVQKERTKRKHLVLQQKQELLQKKREHEEFMQKNQQTNVIQIQKEDYDNLAYQNLELKQEISDLEYEKSGLMDRFEQQEQCIQFLINSVSENINKLCQAPPVQDLQQYFYQTEEQNALDSYYNNNNNNIQEHNENENYLGEEEYQYGEVQIEQINKTTYQQYFQQSNQMKNILNQCVDKILQEYFNMVEYQSHSQRHTTASEKTNAPQQYNEFSNFKKTILDREEEIKKVRIQQSEINGKFQALLVEYNNLVNEKKNIMDKQEDLERNSKYTEMENVEIKQENVELKEQIENLMNEISSKEENFTCIVEGLQLMRDEILDQVDLLQEETKNQQTQIEQMQAQNSSTLKVSYLENKLKEKDSQIKQLVKQIDTIQLSESHHHKSNQSMTSAHEMHNQSSSQYDNQATQNDNVSSLKVKNQQLTQETSQLKCQLQSMNNKNQYLEKLVLQLQQNNQQSIHDRQHSNKENTNPNILNSELSFKVCHNRTPSQNSQQFQSKQFSLLNQRNVELQQQLEASSTLMKELEQKIVQRDSSNYRSSSKHLPQFDDLQSCIQTQQSYASASNNNLQNPHFNGLNYNIQNNNNHQNIQSSQKKKSILDGSSSQQVLQQQPKQSMHQKNYSLKQLPNPSQNGNTDIISYAFSPNYSRLNNKF